MYTDMTLNISLSIRNTLNGQNESRTIIQYVWRSWQCMIWSKHMMRILPAILPWRRRLLKRNRESCDGDPRTERPKSKSDTTDAQVKVIHRRRATVKQIAQSLDTSVSGRFILLLQKSWTWAISQILRMLAQDKN